MKTTSNLLPVAAMERHRVIRIIGNTGREENPDLKASRFLTEAGFVAEGGRNADLAFKGARPLGNDFFLDLSITPGEKRKGNFSLIRGQNGVETTVDVGEMYDLDRTRDTMIISGSSNHLAYTQVVVSLLPVGKEKKPDPSPPPPAPPPDPDQPNPAQADQGEVEIPLGEIEPWPEQPRTYFKMKPLLVLAESMNSLFQVKAIMVRLFREGEARRLHPGSKYQIVDGERRWRARDLIRAKTIKAVIVYPKDMVEQHRMSVIANLHQEKHSHYELARAVIFQHDHGRSAAQIAADFSNKSVAWVYAYLKLKTLVSELFELLNPAVDRDKRLSLRTAKILASVKPGAQLTIWEKAQQEGKAHGPQGILVRLQELAEDDLSETVPSGRKRPQGSDHVMRPVNRALATIGYNTQLLVGITDRFKKRTVKSDVATRAEVASQARAMAEKLLAFSQAIMN